MPENVHQSVSRENTLLVSAAQRRHFGRQRGSRACECNQGQEKPKQHVIHPFWRAVIHLSVSRMQVLDDSFSDVNIKRKTKNRERGSTGERHEIAKPDTRRGALHSRE